MVPLLRRGAESAAVLHRAPNDDEIAKLQNRELADTALAQC